MWAKDLTQQQLDNFSMVERIGSAMSLAGTAIIAITFLSSKAFHKPINRLIFYASIGNVFTNIATTIARATLEHNLPHLCQFQAFLIQMFLPADAFWTFAMALNVYLTFYHQFGAQQLRRLEKWYIIFCYGVPFVPALTFLFVNSKKKGRMYGNATIWCWIASNYDTYRIALFYGPVWVVILTTIAIYLRAGRDIWRKRQQLRDFSVPAPDPIPIMHDPFTSVKTTEVYVTSDTIVTSSDSIDLRQMSPNPGQYPRMPAPAARSYHIEITAATNPEQASPNPNPNRLSSAEKFRDQDRKGSIAGSIVPIAAPNPASAYPTRRYATMEANTAIWSYAKVAMLFFVAMMVTWIPSSANRLYSVIKPDQVSVTLEYIAAFVLPLQGFWNALIYIITSWKACKELWSNLKTHRRFSARNLGTTMAAAFSSETDNQSYRNSRLVNSKRSQETESMTGLQHSRPTTSSRPNTKDGEPV